MSDSGEIDPEFGWFIAKLYIFSISGFLAVVSVSGSMVNIVSLTVVGITVAPTFYRLSYKLLRTRGLTGKIVNGLTFVTSPFLYILKKIRDLSNEIEGESENIDS